MTTLWVLVANSGFAEIFEIKGHGSSIKQIESIDNPNGRKKISEITSDRPGRAFDRSGQGRHALEKQVDPHTHELQIFAHKLAEVLNKGLKENRYTELALIAPPQFLGELNANLPENIKKLVIKEVHKDLPPLSPQEKIEHLADYLDLWNRK